MLDVRRHFMFNPPGKLYILFGISFCIQATMGIRLMTPDDRNFSFPLSNRGFKISNLTNLTLSIKACSDAHIFIQESEVPDLYDYHSYAFVLGFASNTASAIRLGPVANREFNRSEERYVLSCDEFRPFWISWKNGDLMCGKGKSVGESIISRHSIQLTTHPNFLFLLTGWSSYGCWNIDTGFAPLFYGFNRKSNNSMLSGADVIESPVRSRLHCSYRCITPSVDIPCGCQQYSYNSLTKQCLIVDASKTVLLIDKPGWNTWSLQ